MALAQRTMSALPPKADIGTQSRNVRFVPIADSCVAAISAEPHREWCCYSEATPREFLSAMEIEARAATKRNPKPSTQHRSVGEFVASLRLLSWAAHPGGLSYAIVIRHSCCTDSFDCNRRRAHDRLRRLRRHPLQRYQGRFYRGRLWRQRHAGVPRPALSDLDRGSELWIYLRRLSDRFCRHGQQHPNAVRR